MGFHDVTFPVTISYGVTFGPGHSTAIVEVDAGQEERTGRYPEPRRRGNAALGVRSRSDLSTVLTFAIARQGALNGFRWKDWSDYTSASDHVSASAYGDQQIGVGDGVTTQFQLVKLYNDGSGFIRTRTIVKPVAGTVTIGVAGSSVGSGWSVNSTTGIVTFSVAPTAGQVITAGYQFECAVRFDVQLDALLGIRLDDFDNGSLPDLPVVELMSETPTDEEFWYGGAKDFGSMTADASITENDGRVLKFTPTAARNLTLPNPASLQTGGPKFFIINGSGSFAITLKDHLGTTVATIAALGAVTVCLMLDAASSKSWVAF